MQSKIHQEDEMKHHFLLRNVRCLRKAEAATNRENGTMNYLCSKFTYQVVAGPAATANKDCHSKRTI
jgi:hypothetical protein